VIFEEEEERNLMVVLDWSYDLWKGVAWCQQWWREENFSPVLFYKREREGTCSVVLCLFLKEIIS